MTCDFVELAREGVQALQPYQPGKPVEDLQRELGLSDIVKLASNENPLGPSSRVLEAIASVGSDLTRYPDGNGFILKQALSKQLSVPAATLTLGNGSNDVLELIARAYLNPGDEVIMSQHAFAVYYLVTKANDAIPVTVPAKDWGHDLEAMARKISPNTRIVFIANPNNPTGTWVNRSGLEAFLKSVPDNVIVVLDEAYIEYVADPEYPDGLDFLPSFPNLVITRTFSKAYGLAALRVGYGISAPEIADVLNRVRQPFNVNSLALAAAVAALDDRDYLSRSVETNNRGMQQIEAGLAGLGLYFIRSVGNFISFRIDDAARVYDDLLRQGVIVRPVAMYDMPDFLRVSIGTEKENAIFLEKLKLVMAGKS